MAACWLLGVAVVFAVNLRLARTRAVNSDGASNALQAWDMLHGNLLLHGWMLSDVSFYTTELPQYMLVELWRGLGQDVVHVAAAMTYTLAMLLAALLAKGDAAGRQALARVLVAGGIMLAPQLASGVNILLSSPDHIGTSVPVMLTWLVMDRARLCRPGGTTPSDPPARAWYIPVLVGLLLAWAQVADMLVLYIGVLPLVLVSLIRAGRAVAVEREPLASQWYDLALAAAAVVSAAAAVLALHVIHAHGGFYMPAPTAQIAPVGTILGRNLGVLGQGLLLLGGADFLGLGLAAGGLFALLHLAGVMLAACGLGLAAWRFFRDHDRVSQLLLVAVLVNVAVYLISDRPSVVTQTREIAVVLPLSAALAGRMLGGRLLAARLKAARLLVPVLLVVLLGYLAGTISEISQPAAPAQDQQLASWLAARHLRTGLSGYWESNVVTLTSGDQVRVRLVQVTAGRLVAGARESKAQWYDPGRQTADFVVLFPGVPGYGGFTSERAVLATFGRPARTYHVGSYTILVWNRNLLSDLR